jgi:hypothetical protein
VLARQVLYYLSHTFIPFLLLDIFQVESSVFAWDWSQTVILLPIASHVAGITGKHHWAYKLRWGPDSDYPVLALSHGPPNIHPPSKWDYRYKSLYLV